MERKLFDWALLGVCLWLVAGLCCCAPRLDKVKAGQAAGTYLAAPNRLYDDDGEFDIRKTVIYEPVVQGFNPATNVTNKALTHYRCTWCHECGFQAAWDIENEDKPGWRPRYKGETWKAIVQRMGRSDATMLNEQIADRIYSYLRDASLGKYDESKDTQGAVVRHVDELPKEVLIETPGKHPKQPKKDESKAPQAESKGK
jgi:hypothetical protein